jgi:hypothetical protein
MPTYRHTRCGLLSASHLAKAHTATVMGKVDKFYVGHPGYELAWEHLKLEARSSGDRIQNLLEKAVITVRSSPTMAE